MQTPFLINMHSFLSGLGFPRTFSAPQEHLDHTLMPARSPTELPDVSCFESLMSDPMTHLVMSKDNVTELEVRGVISSARAHRLLEDVCEKEETAALPVSLQDHCVGPVLDEHNRTADRRAIENGENEGMAPA